MRQIGTLPHENNARRLINYYKKLEIESSCEVVFEPQSSHMNYQIWIKDEDKIDEASQIFAEFEKNPTDSKFDAPEPEPEPIPEPVDDGSVPEKPSHHFHTYLTYFLIALCAFVFFISTLQRIEITKTKKVEEITPIQALLMYDVPERFDNGELDGNSPYWKGLYGWVVAKFKASSPASSEGPLFEKIREGEIWRLFTPCILHKDLLHILFNMLWLWYLGRPIEQRIGPLRVLLFTLVAGVLTNTCQYLMSGPFFIGYSGIVTALAGFIWMREKISPWEGYPLNRGTILFLLFFILAILGLQIAAFLIQVFTSYSFAPNIANTAHVSGLIIGAILGRFGFFAQRIKA